MQLKKIKLAGFKSFVDPTTVLLPSHLVAVVGPNGCGKSNIIDAVCWVMGESSAKYLRGESLTDVIFNGSSARKPVGQASVELIFDNQDGSLGGEYASYAEISIRRLITRDSESSYFLNGTRCRRRDIIDIFLGTGLGPRSYSIIGQNMISRVIEAKADEMRTYLEEAAGISKYKERRRETENRIQHTKDNLARLDDVRSELDKQLASLKRQANAAEKYKALKQEERTLKAQWLAIQWRDLDTQLVDYTLQIQQQSTGLEARQTDLGEINLQLDYKRDAQRISNEAFQEIQRRYYTVGNDITRLEQEIHHAEERKHQCQSDLTHVKKELAQVNEELVDAETTLYDLAEEIKELSPEAEEARALVNESLAQLSQSEETMLDWQTRWDVFNQQSAKTMQGAQVEKTRIQHIEERLTSIQARQKRFEQEKAQFDFSGLEKEIQQLSKEVGEVVTEVKDHEQRLTLLQTQLSSLKTEEQKTVEKLAQTRSDLQKCRGQQASLDALQETALGQRNRDVMQWLTKHGLEKKARLGQSIEVDRGWEYALEKVLGASLQAICVEKVDDIVPLASDFKVGNLNVVSHASLKASLNKEHTLLLDKVKSPWPLEALLAGIYIAESEKEALSLRETLAPHESVVTREGLWLGASWLRIMRDDNPEAGVFQRTQELKQLVKKIESLTEEESLLTQKQTEMREQLKQLETERTQLQKEVQRFHAKSAEKQAQEKMKKERLRELQKQAERFQKEQEEAASQWQEASRELTLSRDRWNASMKAIEEETGNREALQKEREHLRSVLQNKRDEVNQAKEAAHQLEIRWETTKSQHASLQHNVTRMQGQLKTLTERQDLLQKEWDTIGSLEAVKQQLSDALTKRLDIETELNNARVSMDTINQEWHAMEMKRQEIEREIAHFRDILETLRIDWQGLKVKSETLLEQVKETGHDIETILQHLSAESNATEWHAELEQVTQRIARLGAINLVAIEEYSTCSERKEYLDKQYADLQEGLATLESAIAKIDKETRTRFKETFDTVNTCFQELFPKIFGGGRAYLELTGDNLLDAGVTVMASPPGKRNSTIHLLSGGEKAMTAIALVFSIFHLNPAPFCLLDEVDAPLDDANIGRFCQLVKSMAEKTQFIFISHNKLAIEMAEHLMGVTMHEPGVSRLVSVDVHEAVSLAGA